jgi:hypothetical protein
MFPNIPALIQPLKWKPCSVDNKAGNSIYGKSKGAKMNPLLAFIPLFTLVVILILLGGVIGSIARKKHRNIWLWRIAGALGFPIALVSILLFKDYHSLSEEQQSRSQLKEKLIFCAVILLWAGSLFMRFRGANI